MDTLKIVIPMWLVWNACGACIGSILTLGIAWIARSVNVRKGKIVYAHPKNED